MTGIGYLPDWSPYLHRNPLAWLLQRDNPSARYLTLTQLLGRPEEDSEVTAARAAIADSRPARDILEAQFPQGYWVKPDRGYSPTYRATIWQVLFLAKLGLPRLDAIRLACEHVMAHAYLEDLGLFSAHKHAYAFLCLNGDLLWALCWFRYEGHAVFQRVSERLAQRVSREGFRCRYNAQTATDRRTWLPCAWGAIKVLRAFAAMPATERSPEVTEAIQSGVDFLLEHDLAAANYPNARGISRRWFQLGFPLAYDSDILEGLEVLAELGLGHDARLRGPVKWLLDKQDAEGRWPLERTLSRTWSSFGRRGEPNKWVTLRVLRTLARIDPSFLTSSAQEPRITQSGGPGASLGPL